MLITLWLLYFLCKREETGRNIALTSMCNIKKTITSQDSVKEIEFMPGVSIMDIA